MVYMCVEEFEHDRPVVTRIWKKGLRMEKVVEDGCSPFSRLPDDIVVQIYNKVMDLKTLCYCQLISKRLGLIVFQADTISFDVPLRFDYENENCLEDMKNLFESLGPFRPPPFLGSDSFPSAIKFIKRFRKLKSICIQFPSYVNVVAVVEDDGFSFFTWKIKFGTRADSLAIQAQNSEDVLEEEEEVGSDEERDDTDEENDKTCYCLMDAADRLKKVLGCAVEFPLLENLFIMDSNEREIVTLIGGQGDELRNFLYIHTELVSIGLFMMSSFLAACYLIAIKTNNLLNLSSSICFALITS